ncbi:ATP-dependent DNA helicase PIF1 [Mycena sanguinolenta]|uniref:U4/U6 snRNA-associated-splicing factor PRP24 n=1 Tax=Mycena sanguinolenta TaxID=230812 RepID=A0A8H6XRE2_9AGAR|nr:ATP-dependent DNA helicase PIF1 [Mycena sanguinolenta]
MDESQTLDALANVLGEIERNPYDISLHAKHLGLTQSLEGMQEDALAAMEMMTSFFAVGEDVWLALIKAKEETLDLDSANGVEELLALYKRAEEDYLSIPILKRHAEFILGRCERYSDTEKPQELGELFSDDWTREALQEIVNKGIWHWSQSHLLWDQLCEWELQKLQNLGIVPDQGVSNEESAQAIARVEEFILARLGQPHAASEETVPFYSSFTTNYKPSSDYESLLVKASKIRGQATKIFQKRENPEMSLETHTLESYAVYIGSERRSNKPNYPLLSTLYERAIAEAAKKRFSGEQGAEEALRAFWAGYCDTTRISEAGISVELALLQRAVRSVPGSGEVWARYLRCLERAEDQDEASVQSISDICDKALSTNLLQSDVEQLVPVLLARAGYYKRRYDASVGDEESFVTLVAALETDIELVHKASLTGDPRFRLEKYLASVYLKADMTDSAIEVWSAATIHYKTSYTAWISYTDELIKNGQYEKARKTFEDVCRKKMDWSEAIWEAWRAFEYLHGSVQQIDECGDKIEKAQYQVNSQRAKDAEKAAAQYAEQLASAPVAQAPVPEISPAEPMDVDSGPRGTKRAAEDAGSEEGHKKAKIDSKPATLKRDREHSTVFVADLPTGVTEEELTALFKDCGKIREVKITELSGAVVATVEFFERDSVPAALTKDKKRLRDQEVAVHLAWKSTLYVTNFPESADDASMRELFGRYGILFDVRWPSKKFKNTRRFCYVQFTSPVSAQSALELHGRELEPGMTLNVLISNPERKKERTDQDADEREIYVAGLSKFTTKVDLEKLFKVYGDIKDVRMTTDKDGHSKGFAFVEFEDEKSAQAALEANNQELKKRRIAVTMADSRVRAKKYSRLRQRAAWAKKADARNRSVRVRNLPVGTQEGLLQQAMEKIAKVKRVEVFADLNEAVIELENAAEASKLLLRTEPVIFNDNTLKLSEESTDQAALKSEGLFVPRAAKPRAGLGFRKAIPRSAAAPVASGSRDAPASAAPAKGKGQDDFRKMLG